jgi:protein arginine N-methyltransferase 3
MLDSVLVGRDRWLSEKGIMAPSCTKMIIGAFGDEEWYNDRMNFWNDVYGFKMTAMKIDDLEQAIVAPVTGNGIISDQVVIKEIDTRTINPSELDFSSDFTLTITQTGKFYAFCGWFDTYFEGEGVEKVMFSTSPFTKQTHWMQTLFVLENPLEVLKGDIIFGTIQCHKSDYNKRNLEISITFGKKGHRQICQKYKVH